MNNIMSLLDISKEYLSNVFSPKDKNTIIDPLTCIIKLGLLTFKPLGTKISIQKNSISFHEPGLLQGTIRWTQGDAREDLHNLCYPIIKATEWYDIKEQDIKNIFTFGKNGLETLSNSYEKNSTISHSLKHYINIINSKLIPETKHNIEVCDNNKIYNELRKLWNKREINIINNLFLEIAENKTDINKKNCLMESINMILSIKEKNIHNLLVQSATVLI